MRNRKISLILTILALPSLVWGVIADARQDGKSAESSFFYRFENKRFFIPLIEIDLSAAGTGEVRFKRGEADEIIDRKLTVLPTTASRIRQLYDVTKFISSTAEYQDKKDFSHLGWVTLGARDGGRERKTKFNYTQNLEIKELSDIFRALATQEIDLLDIENARQYQPLDLPHLLDTLENDLGLGRIAEPQQMLATLKDISGDDSQPLIARNHASRMMAAIKNGKFKSPVGK